MLQIKKILCPVDGSEHSLRAAKYAMELAKLLNAKIILTYCHKPFPAILGEPFYQQTVSRIIETSHTILEPFRSLFSDNNIKFSERIVEGPAGQAVSEIAEIERCDLIVMGSRGYSNLQGLVLGSVAHRVLHSTTCPVFIVR